MHNSVSKKILTLAGLKPRLAVWRLKSQRIVFTNGVFDIVHPGHIDYLFRAAEKGNRLVIGINSDASVKTLNKGTDRPINSETSRAIILAALGVVDAVVVFDEPTPEHLIRIIQPDVLVKGGDYDADNSDPNSKQFIVGSEFVRKLGGEVAVIPFLEGFSSTNIIEKIRGNG